MIVDERSEQVVSNTDRVEVAGEMKIDVFHRHNLRVTPTGGAALHAEAGTKTRFAQANDGVFADSIKSISEADRRRGLTFAGCRRRHRSNQNQLGVRTLLYLVEIVQRNLRFEVAIQQQVAQVDPKSAMADLRDRQHVRFLRNFDVGLWISM